MQLFDDVKGEYTCCRCDKTYSSPENFYRTNSLTYAKTGYLPVCKTCIGEIYDYYAKKYKSEKRAVQRVCMAFNVYYNDVIFNKIKDDVASVIGTYFRLMNMVQYKNRTFDTTLDEGFKYRKLFETMDAEPKKNDIDPDDVTRWGAGFSAEDYETLNSHYRLLKTSNPNCDSNQEIFIIDLCYTKMQQMKAVREGKVDDYNKLTDSYRKSFQQAGLKTSKDTSSAEDFTMGVNIEAIEKYTPAEYYKNKKLFSDYDSLRDYIERFLLRPLRNLMHGTHDRDYEYYVKEDDNGDIDQDDE